MRYVLVVLFVLTAGFAAAQDARMPVFFRGMVKTQTQLAADATLIDRAMQSHDGDRVAAAQTWAGMGWTAIAGGDGEQAVRRFNQAFLLDPANPGLAYGMMIAAHIRGDSADIVDGLFAEAQAAMPPEEHKFVFVDYAQILIQRGELGRAVEVLDPYKTDPRALEILHSLNRVESEASE